MSKAYKIKVNQGAGEAKFVDIPQAGVSGKPLSVKAVPGGKYQLLDGSTGYAPENIRASRSGKDLQVFFEGRAQPDLVIEEYYEVTPEGFNGLIGESESGRFYEYIPETAVGNSAVPLLSDGSTQVGMALGGPEINASGAAVGALVAAAGLNPLLLAPLALLGAGGGGGGGGGGGDGDGDNTDNKNAKITVTSVDEDTGLEIDDWVTRDQTLTFGGELTNFNGTLGDKVRLDLVLMDGDEPSVTKFEGFATLIKPATSAAGKWVWSWTPEKDGKPIELLEGNYQLTATLLKKDDTAYEGIAAKKELVIDLTAGPENNDAKIFIDSITDDTGVDPADWITSDQTLTFSGRLTGFNGSVGDGIRLELSQGDKIITAYVKPVAPNPSVPGSPWTWTWENGAPLDPGTYLLKATLVDLAGNTYKNVSAGPKTLTVDTTGDTGAAEDVKITGMTKDSGFGAEGHESRKDFKTNDNTPVFKGTVKSSNSVQWIEVKLTEVSEKAEAYKESQYIKIESGQTTWTWTPPVPEKGLADAAYTLTAQAVDLAGNPAVNAQGATIVASQAVVIDTRGSTDENDNAAVSTTSISITEDTGESNSDFVTSAGGEGKGGLKFTGKLAPEFIDNGGRVLVQIVDSAGKIKSSAYVKPGKDSWTYDNSVVLADGQYLAKTILIDHVGNMISATDQAFYIDTVKATHDPSLKTNVATDANGVEVSATFEDFFFKITEYGSYSVNGGVVKNYTGGHLVLNSSGKTYKAGEFSINFKDQAGNETIITNPNEWIFKNPANPLSFMPSDAGYLGPKKFDGSQAVGSMGKLTIDSNTFDMASLYDGIPTIPDQAAANHIVLSDANKNVELTLSLGDVLALGVTNSFSVNSSPTLPHKGKIQMLIDGQDGDKINLDGWVGVENFVWTKPGEAGTSNAAITIGNGTYNVYTHNDLGIALFVNTQIKDITVV